MDLIFNAILVLACLFAYFAFQKTKELEKANREINAKLLQLEAMLAKFKSKILSKESASDEKADDVSSSVIKAAQIESKDIAVATSADKTRMEQQNQIKVELNNQKLAKSAPEDSMPQYKALPLDKIQKPLANSLSFEKFVGENLISKIGILIIVIGVGIGAKYAIDNQLISPLTRIILAYLVGVVLFVLAIKLKKDYLNYSAVLLSGAMAIMYFISYLAYSLYDLMPQLVCFLMMLLFTIFTVIAALNYNKQVIALFGLVGAYAVPFLLSDGSGRADILFSYIALVNLGIVIIAFKKYWNPLYYSAFAFTWAIYLSWFIFEYDVEQYFNLALIFALVFFITFYLTTLAYKLIRQEKIEKPNVALLLTNSFIFYGVGYSLLKDHEIAKNLLGLFTLANALIHFAVSVVVYKQKLGDKNLFYLVSGLVLLFISIAVPVQLEGNWVTLVWAGEAALLFWIGRSKDVSFYEKLSYPLMVVAFISLNHDWSEGYEFYDTLNALKPIFNVYFLTSLLFIVVFAFINYMNQRHAYFLTTLSKDQGRLSVLWRYATYALPVILIYALYGAFYVEIDNYWNIQYLISKVEVTQKANADPFTIFNRDILNMERIWIVNYTLLFVSILGLINNIKIRNKILAYASMAGIAYIVICFLSVNLSILDQLRSAYLNAQDNQYYEVDIFNIAIRYICYLLVFIALWVFYKALRLESIQEEVDDTHDFNLNVIYDVALHVCVLWMASSELVNILILSGFEQVSSLAMSILWGVYALLLIVLGLLRNKKHLRLAAMVLFVVTLLKLFLIDLANLDTISKTVVFVSLGVLLMVVSFLYSKYKYLIEDESLSSETQHESVQSQEV